MTGKVLVVNGQKHNLQKSGGLGRYCEQLHRGLSLLDRKGRFGDCDLVFRNFNSVQSSPKVQSEGNGRFRSEKFRFWLSRYCPPVLYVHLQGLYTNIPKSISTTENLAEWSVGSNDMPWSQLSSKTLLHELSNYCTIDEIGRLCLFSKLKLAVTFIDIQDLYYPDHFSDEELRSRRLAYSFYKDRADFFFAISEFTKKTMIESLEIEPDKIKVTHLAADDLFFKQATEEVSSWVRSFGRYWIYPAKAWAHKNHEFLLKAIGKRAAEIKKAGLRLLLTGGFSSADKAYLEDLICKYCEGIVEILGFVSDEQLQQLIRQADYLIFPSLYEGFGMPVLEAMTLGCPVVSSNAGSLPEIGGDALVYFDPSTEEELIIRIDGMLTGDDWDRENLISMGQENAKRFSWERTVETTFEGYKENFL